MYTSGEMIGKYKVVRRLGKGGMGTVYLAWDEDLNREVAVKVIDTKHEEMENALKRFRQEAQAIASLDSHHIVRIYDYGTLGETAFLVMEYVRGETLSEIIAAEGAMTVDTVTDYARQLLDGLSHAHEQNIIHRDMKPANVLVSHQGVVKITDFGLARSLDVESGLTVTGMVVGTVHYLAPEVARGEDATIQSDLYSLGVTLYEMLTGDVPIEDESPLKIITRIANETPEPARMRRKDIPAPLDAWLMRMLEHDISLRYRSAKEALLELDRASGSRIESIASQTEQIFTDETAQLEIAEAGVSPSPEAPPPSRGSVSSEDVEVILARALQVERDEAGKLDEEAFLEIAIETGVDIAAAREALRLHKEAQASRLRREKIIRIVSVAGAILIVAVFISWRVLRRPDQTRRNLRAGGGDETTIDRHGDSTSPSIDASWIDIGMDWTSLDLDTESNTEIIGIRASNDTPMLLRVGNSDPIKISGMYYGPAKGSGDIQLRLISEGAGVLAAAISLSPMRLASLPFVGGEKGTELGDLAIAVGDVVSTRLAATQAFEVVERIQVDKVLANLQLEQSEYFDPETAGRIGKVLGTEYLINGSVQKVGNRYRLTARRVDAESGKVLDNIVVDGTQNQLFDLQDKLAEDLAWQIARSEIELLIPKP